MSWRLTGAGSRLRVGAGSASSGRACLRGSGSAGPVRCRRDIPSQQLKGAPITDVFRRAIVMPRATSAGPRLPPFEHPRCSAFRAMTRRRRPTDACPVCLCEFSSHPQGPETPFRWPSCGHALHLGCVARKIANVRDLRCPTCRAPWPPQAADVFTSACRAHGVPAPQPAADQDITTHQYHQALAPRAPSHVLPFCCPGLFLADSANAASDGAWQELPDRHMHWAPVHSRQTGCWSPEWVCTRCNSTVDEHHPLLQGVPAAPVCLTHGTRRFALDLREYSRGWVCFCGSPPGVLHCPGQRVPLPEAPTATEILAPVSWPNCRAGRRSLVPPRPPQHARKWTHTQLAVCTPTARRSGSAPTRGA